MSKNSGFIVMVIAFIVAFEIGVFLDGSARETVPAAKTLSLKIFSGSTDGNQASKLERKITDWLALNEKTIEVVNQTQSNRGMDTVITIWYRGSAKEAAKPGTPTPGLHNLPGDPLPLDKESRGQKPGLDIPDKK